MSARATSSGRDLQSIARRAMLERGFQPDFGAAVLTELGAIPGPAATQSPSIRDLRGLLWASIDNDDSLDLDQLSVAEPLADGRVKVHRRDICRFEIQNYSKGGHHDPNQYSTTRRRAGS